MKARYTKAPTQMRLATPVQENHWSYRTSISVIRRLMTDRVYSLTLGGLEKATKELSR
ncbi:hypothetical protein [Rhizobium tropici]|uniref:hypothetical protein n=1 Tax=Rhizobium tropici TaxID=398 RepID=UPI00165FE92F|nr:hypothetical protein [Rhizobium tropici]